MKLLITTQVVDKNHPILGFFHRWIEEFAKHFEEVHVICLQKGDYTLPTNVTVYSLGKEKGETRIKYIYRFYKYFGQVFFRVRVDYVFFHMGAIYNIMAAPFFLIRKWYNTKFYWWKTHGHLNVFGRMALKFVDKVLSATEASFPLQTSKKKVIGHAIDIELFNYIPTSTQKSVLLFVGRISRIKNVQHVLYITERLRSLGYHLETRIVGDKTDKQYYLELQGIATHFGIQDQVVFIDGVTQAQLYKEYRQALVLINPSDTDSVDKVVLEAMACGTLPVTSNLAFDDMLSPYNLFIKKGDIDMYAESIVTILNMDTSVYNQFTSSLSKVVVNNHALSTFTQRIFD